MKTALLSFFSVLLIYQSSAQQVTPPLRPANFRKGSWQVGVRDGYQGGLLIGNRNTLQGQAGYYLINQLAVGLSGTWAREGVRTAAFHDLTVGPYARFQITPTRLSPFVDLSYQVGRRISGNETAFTFSSLSLSSAQVSPGISVGVTPYLRAELSYHFQWLSVDNWSAYIGQPQLGVTYLLNRH